MGSTERAALGSIEGKVLKAETGEPLRGARVQLDPIGVDSEEALEVVTDESGEFSFALLKAGQYNLSVHRAGYVSQNYGERPERPGRSRGSPIGLLPGQKMREITFKMVAGGVTKGRVYDHYGDPVAEAQVEVLRWAPDSTRGYNGAGSGMTNDRGEYRVYGLTPGDYVVSATPPSSGGFTSRVKVLRGNGNDLVVLNDRGRESRAQQEPAEPREIGGQTYFPGALEAGRASRIEVGAGREVAGIDITILRRRVFSVRGSVVLPPGVATREAMVMLWSQEPGMGEGGEARVAADGTFEIPNARPGSYRLVAMAGAMEDGQEGVQLSAQQELVVGNADIEDVRLTLARGGDISGRVRVEGKSEPPAGFVEIASADESVFSFGGGAQIEKDGTFVARGVVPGNYRPSVHLQEDRDKFYLKEARLGGRDVRESMHVPEGGVTGLELLVGADGGSVTGRVLNDEHLPVAGARVMLLPTSVRLAHLDSKQVEADQNGIFNFEAIRPGEYKVLAFDAEIEDMRVPDAEAPQKHESKSKTIRVGASSTPSVEIQAIRPEKP